MKSKVKIKKRPDYKKLNKVDKSFKKGGDSVKVGLPKNSNNYPDGASVIKVGLIHEFGEPALNVPERSFLRSTLKEKQQSYKKFLKDSAKKIAAGKTNKVKALNLLGLSVVSDVVGKISDGIEPALAVRTGTPLIDTGHLRRSITYIVE